MFNNQIGSQAPCGLKRIVECTSFAKLWAQIPFSNFLQRVFRLVSNGRIVSKLLFKIARSEKDPALHYKSHNNISTYYIQCSMTNIGLTIINHGKFQADDDKRRPKK